MGIAITTAGRRWKKGGNRGILSRNSHIAREDVSVLLFRGSHGMRLGHYKQSKRVLDMDANLVQELNLDFRNALQLSDGKSDRAFVPPEMTTLTVEAVTVSIIDNAQTLHLL